MDCEGVGEVNLRGENMKNKKAFGPLGWFVLVLIIFGLILLSINKFCLNIIGLGMLFLVLWIVFGLAFYMPLKKFGFVLSIPTSIFLIILGFLFKVIGFC